tara:strand:+ start:6008 stop:6166 length:159 start_codon:yes stop_codon:yes gene_type:complete
MQTNIEAEWGGAGTVFWLGLASSKSAWRAAQIAQNIFIMGTPTRVDTLINND